MPTFGGYYYIHRFPKKHTLLTPTSDQSCTSCWVPSTLGPFFPQKITHAKELHQSDRGSCRCHICSLHFGPWILASVDPPAKHIGIWGLGSTNDHQLSYFIIPVHIYHPYSKKHKLPTTHLMEPGRVSMKSLWKQLPPNMVRNKPRNGRLICSTSEVLKIGESHWCHGDTVTKRQKTHLRILEQQDPTSIKSRCISIQIRKVALSVICNHPAMSRAAMDERHCRYNEGNKKGMMMIGCWTSTSYYSTGIIIPSRHAK
jgi:hypothetical protein